MLIKKIDKKTFLILDWRIESEREKIYQYVEENPPVLVTTDRSLQYIKRDTVQANKEFLKTAKEHRWFKKVLEENGLTAKEEIDDHKGEFFIVCFDMTDKLKEYLKGLVE